MQENLAFAERNVPRYTSYPTAPHFTADVTAATYAAWLGGLTPAHRLSLYLHVPYCTNLCLYCGCHTQVMRRQTPLDRYAELLQREAELVGAAAGARAVTHLHWGGGTPSILGSERLWQVFESIARHFDLSGLASHDIELDPRHVPADLVATLGSLGVTRASLGVQTFAPHVQEAIGRVQPLAQVRKVVEMLRAAGIVHLNFDLMYGLPHQTRDDLARTIDLACALAPDRIALFGYAHVPWFKARQRLIDASALPGLIERLNQAAFAAAQLTAQDYVAVGLDHFARPGDSLAVAARTGTLRRNFQGYTTDDADALIGLGTSAIGRLPQGYVQNISDVGNYARAIEGERMATARGRALSAEDRLRGRLIEVLMCDLAVDLGAMVAQNGWSPPAGFAAERGELQKLAAQGLVALDGARVTVTEAGRPFVRLVAAVFDSYLADVAARHSVAV